MEKITNLAITILKKNFNEGDFIFSHSLRVALILKGMGLDDVSVSCGVLHEFPETVLESLNELAGVGEDCQKDILKVIKKFKQLEELCSGKIKFKFQPLNKWQKFFLDLRAENLRKMFFAITGDLRPIFLSLANKLDEMQNIGQFKKEEQIRKCLESLEIFSPLAYGLGMGEIKGQLEDLAFPLLYPKEYQWLENNVKEKYKEQKEYLRQIKLTLAKILEEENIKPIKIEARTKHYFSLYQKLLRYNMDIDKIYDLVALRIIVPDVETCYQTLGVLHKFYQPLPSRIKDYVASPKPNGYRALHTTVICLEGRIVEIQIKTYEMYREAEYGPAAHLEYKEELPKKTYKHQFYWLEQLRKWQEEVKDTKKISEYLRSELFKDRIFVMTPKGDVINLPREATPIDFAYAVHTAIGNSVAGCKINGKISKLSHPLKGGETIEIIKDDNAHPSADWLLFAKTKLACDRIKKWLEKNRGLEISIKKKETKTIKKSILSTFFPIRPKNIVQICLEGEAGFLVSLAKCCLPKEGDEIEAFITKIKGAAIHKKDCENLKKLKERCPEKIITATWRKFTI